MSAYLSGFRRRREEVIRDDDTVARGSTSAAGGRTLGAGSSASGTEQNSGASDDEHASAMGIPPEEYVFRLSPTCPCLTELPFRLEWSDWYNWASDDGIQERAKMLNAIQRQYPNFPCLLGD